MFASRAQHISEVILPAMNRGTWVLCDRYTDSSEAYQGAGRQLGVDAVLTLHRVICLGLQPDLTLLLDNDVAASLARARRRNLAAGERGRRKTLRAGEPGILRARTSAVSGHCPARNRSAWQ